MRPLPVLLSLLLLSACAPELSPRGSADLAACRRSADRSMGRDASIDPASEHSVSDPMGMVQREQTRSPYQTMVDQCMVGSH